MRSADWLAAAGFVALLAGCASTPTPSSIGPIPTGGSGANVCVGVDLRGPDGTTVNLTGTWEGLNNLWFVTQSGSCVTIEGLSRYGGESIGESHRFVFSGDLRPDFSVVGRWTWTWVLDAPGRPLRGATTDLVLQVEFAEDGETTIEVPSGVMGFDPSDPSNTVPLERTSLRTEFPPP